MRKTCNLILITKCSWFKCLNLGEIFLSDVGHATKMHFSVVPTKCSLFLPPLTKSSNYISLRCFPKINKNWEILCSSFNLIFDFGEEFVFQV